MKTTLVVPVVLALLAAAPSHAQEPSIPGACPGGDAAALDAALARSDAGEGPAADLDVAACYRAMAQDFPEAVALQRALAAGLPEADAAAVNARLDAIGRPQASARFTAPEGPVAAAGDADAAAVMPSAEDDVSPIVPYALAGVAAAALVAGTATAFVALDQDSSGEDATTMGVVAGICGAVAIATGIAAAVLWPDEEVVPTGGPGDVGVGLMIRF